MNSIPGPRTGASPWINRHRAARGTSTSFHCGGWPRRRALRPPKRATFPSLQAERCVCISLPHSIMNKQRKVLEHDAVQPDRHQPLLGYCWATEYAACTPRLNIYDLGCVREPEEQCALPDDTATKWKMVKYNYGRVQD
ncbi:hypothetical protein NDU88_002257 [Pleurodeles waltl]|uniref:Uncharacterized protein n=1 Tax=Pleurodeles waltl TaxID=8319 RepID=A0AAV7P9F1_PLEWA|nr:hypothetical protein NDU88_002257 [Pleurodeles waltl]